MSWKIEICRAKPNPVGKDRAAWGSPRQEQLLGEWVDLRNIGDTPVTLSTIHLGDIEFSQNCIPAKNSTIYWKGSSTQSLSPQQILRVHAGKSLYSSSMLDEDRVGAHLHAYAEKGNFVLNNRCGDVISVWWIGNDGKWHEEDKANYDPNLPEGAILTRVGSKLIPSR